MFDAKVLDVIKRTRDVLSLRFQRPDDFEYLPGQYMFIELNIGGVKKRKHFSLSSSPTEHGYVEITKRLTGHEFSNALNSLKVGDVVSLEAPFGLFTLNKKHHRIIFLTGGIGITPIRSMIRYASDIGSEIDMILLYSCKDEDNIPFREELEKTQSQNPRFKVFHTLTRPDKGWLGLMGRINARMIQSVAPDYLDRVAYVSGPKSMVEDILSILKVELGFNSEQLKYEFFPGFDQEEYKPGNSDK
jgi:ferredoxin-NADP reductase